METRITKKGTSFKQLVDGWEHEDTRCIAMDAMARKAIVHHRTCVVWVRTGALKVLPRRMEQWMQRGDVKSAKHAAALWSVLLAVSLEHQEQARRAVRTMATTKRTAHAKLMAKAMKEACIVRNAWNGPVAFWNVGNETDAETYPPRHDVEREETHDETTHRTRHARDETHGQRKEWDGIQATWKEQGPGATWPNRGYTVLLALRMEDIDPNGICIYRMDEGTDQARGPIVAVYLQKAHVEPAPPTSARRVTSWFFRTKTDSHAHKVDPQDAASDAKRRKETQGNAGPSTSRAQDVPAMRVQVTVHVRHAGGTSAGYETLSLEVPRDFPLRAWHDLAIVHRKGRLSASRLDVYLDGDRVATGQTKFPSPPAAALLAAGRGRPSWTFGCGPDAPMQRTTRGPVEFTRGLWGGRSNDASVARTPARSRGQVAGAAVLYTALDDAQVRGLHLPGTLLMEPRWIELLVQATRAVPCAACDARCGTRPPAAMAGALQVPRPTETRPGGRDPRLNAQGPGWTEPAKCYGILDAMESAGGAAQLLPLLLQPEMIMNCRPGTLARRAPVPCCGRGLDGPALAEVLEWMSATIQRGKRARALAREGGLAESLASLVRILPHSRCLSTEVVDGVRQVAFAIDGRDHGTATHAAAGVPPKSMSTSGDDAAKQPGADRPDPARSDPTFACTPHDEVINGNLWEASDIGALLGDAAVVDRGSDAHNDEHRSAACTTLLADASVWRGAPLSAQLALLRTELPRLLQLSADGDAASKGLDAGGVLAATALFAPQYDLDDGLRGEARQLLHAHVHALLVGAAGASASSQAAVDAYSWMLRSTYRLQGWTNDRPDQAQEAHSSLQGNSALLEVLHEGFEVLVQSTAAELRASTREGSGHLGAPLYTKLRKTVSQSVPCEEERKHAGAPTGSTPFSAFECLVALMLASSTSRSRILGLQLFQVCCTEAVKPVHSHSEAAHASPSTRPRLHFGVRASWPCARRLDAALASHPLTPSVARAMLPMLSEVGEADVLRVGGSFQADPNASPAHAKVRQVASPSRAGTSLPIELHVHAAPLFLILCLRLQEAPESALAAMVPSLSSVLSRESACSRVVLCAASEQGCRTAWASFLAPLLLRVQGHAFTDSIARVLVCALGTFLLHPVGHSGLELLAEEFGGPGQKLDPKQATIVSQEVHSHIQAVSFGCGHDHRVCSRLWLSTLHLIRDRLKRTASEKTQHVWCVALVPLVEMACEQFMSAGVGDAEVEDDSSDESCARPSATQGQPRAIHSSFELTSSPSSMMKTWMGVVKESESDEKQILAWGLRTCVAEVGLLGGVPRALPAWPMDGQIQEHVCTWCGRSRSSCTAFEHVPAVARRYHHGCKATLPCKLCNDSAMSPRLCTDCKGVLTNLPHLLQSEALIQLDDDMPVHIDTLLKVTTLRTVLLFHLYNVESATKSFERADIVGSAREDLKEFIVAVGFANTKDLEAHAREWVPGSQDSSASGQPSQEAQKTDFKRKDPWSEESIDSFVVLEEQNSALARFVALSILPDLVSMLDRMHAADSCRPIATGASKGALATLCATAFLLAEKVHTSLGEFGTPFLRDMGSLVRSTTEWSLVFQKLSGWIRNPVFVDAGDKWSALKSFASAVNQANWLHSIPCLNDFTSSPSPSIAAKYSGSFLAACKEILLGEIETVDHPCTMIGKLAKLSKDALTGHSVPNTWKNKYSAGSLLNSMASDASFGVLWLSKYADPKELYWKLSEREGRARMRQLLMVNPSGSSRESSALISSSKVSSVDEGDLFKIGQELATEYKAAIQGPDMNTDDSDEEEESDTYTSGNVGRLMAERILGEIILSCSLQQNAQTIQKHKVQRINDSISAGYNQVFQPPGVFVPWLSSTILEVSCKLIKPLKVLDGQLLLTNKFMVFAVREVTHDHGVFEAETAETAGSDSREYYAWPLDILYDIQFRRYLLRRCALEFFFLGGSTVFLAFSGGEDFLDLQSKLLFKTILSQKPRILSAVSRPRLLKPRNILQENRWTELWVNGGLSNFEYLMLLNTAAGRTYNDLAQYPIFPWVLVDYDSDELDLSNPAIFRDLTKPVGALNIERFKHIRERFDSFEDEVIPKFMYGSFYSTPGGVLYFLIRLEPFTGAHVALQSGKFDHADRLFFSVKNTWDNCFNSPADVKELIPELFYLPDIFSNSSNLPLGTRQDGETVSHVVLPPWCKGSASEFVRLHRAALESEYVSQNLHHWIDLIFGYKQRGSQAEEANNVFYYLTYEGSVDLDAIKDPVTRSAYESQIANFGQIPAQLFTAPHPARAYDGPSSDSLVQVAVNKTGSFFFNKKMRGEAVPPTLAEDSTSKRSPQTLLGPKSAEGSVLQITFSSSESKVMVLYSSGLLAAYGWLSGPQGLHVLHPRPGLLDRLGLREDNSSTTGSNIGIILPHIPHINVMRPETYLLGKKFRDTLFTECPPLTRVPICFLEDVPKKKKTTIMIGGLENNASAWCTFDAELLLQASRGRSSGFTEGSLRATQHPAIVTSIQATAGGSIALVGLADGTVWVLGISGKEFLESEELLYSKAKKYCRDEDFNLLGGLKMLRVDRGTGNKEATFPRIRKVLYGHACAVTCLAVDVTLGLAFSGSSSDGGTVMVHDFEDGSVLRRLALSGYVEDALQTKKSNTDDSSLSDEDSIVSDLLVTKEGQVIVHVVSVLQGAGDILVTASNLLVYTINGINVGSRRLQNCVAIQAAKTGPFLVALTKTSCLILRIPTLAKHEEFVVPLGASCLSLSPEEKSLLIGMQDGSTVAFPLALE